MLRICDGRALMPASERFLLSYSFYVGIVVMVISLVAITSLGVGLEKLDFNLREMRV